MMLAARGQHSKKRIEANERAAAGQPTAEEFAQQQLGPGQRFGEQGEQRAVFALGGNLPRGRGNRNDQRAHPNQQQADFLQVANDLVVVKDIDRGHDQADEHGQDEKDISVFATIQFLQDDAGNGKYVIHNADGF